MSWLADNALGLLGIGAGAASDRSQRKMHKRSLKQAQSQFDAQMDTSVSRRVADARSAGVHPLFALGASVGASPTISAGGSPSPRGMTDAIEGMARRQAAARLSPQEERMMAAAATRDEAEAAFFNSKTALLGNDLAARGRDGARTFPMGTETPDVAFGPGEFFNPPVATSKRVGVESGLHPSTTEYVRSDGTVGKLYSQSLQADEVNQVRLVANEINHAIDSAELQPKRITDRKIKQMENELVYARKMAHDPKFRRLSNEQKDFLNYWYGRLRKQLSKLRSRK